MEHLQRQEFECFLPLIKQKRFRNRQQIERIEPLFPRYLFLRLNLGQDSISSIRSTRGVVGLVHFGHRIAAVPEPLVDTLLAATNTCGGLVEIPERVFKQGEEIVVETGSLAGLYGIFHAPRGQERVAILLKFMGTQREVVESPPCED